MYVGEKDGKDGPGNMEEGSTTKRWSRSGVKRCGRSQPLVVFTTTTLDALQFDALFWDTNHSNLPRDQSNNNFK